MDSNEDWIIWNASNLLNTIDINQQVRLNICTIFCLISISQCFIFMVVSSIRKKYIFLKRKGNKVSSNQNSAINMEMIRAKLMKCGVMTHFVWKIINFVKTK